MIQAPLEYDTIKPILMLNGSVKERNKPLDYIVETKCAVDS